MSAGWTLVLMAVCVVAGWFLCSYFEEQARTERRRNARRLAEGAERNGLVAGAPAPPAWAPQPIGPNPGQRTEVDGRVAR